MIVVFNAGVGPAGRQDTRADAQTTALRSLGAKAFQLLRPEPGQTVEGAIAALRRDPDVRAVQRDDILRPAATPNDPLFGSSGACTTSVSGSTERRRSPATTSAFSAPGITPSARPRSSSLTSTPATARRTPTWGLSSGRALKTEAAAGTSSRATTTPPTMTWSTVATASIPPGSSAPKATTESASPA